MFHFGTRDKVEFSVSADTRGTQAVSLPRVSIALYDTEGPIDWRLESQDSARLCYVAEGSRLEFVLEEADDYSLLRFKLTGSPRPIVRYSASITLPTDMAHAVMAPNTRKIAHTLIYYHEHRTWPENPTLYRCLLPDRFEEPAAANHEAPLVVLTDNQGNNALTVGWTRAVVGAVLNGDADGDVYTVTLTRQEDVAFSGDALEDALFVSMMKQPWMKSAENYARVFDAINGRVHEPAPEWAFEPVFCTWYCYEDHISQDDVLKIARKCKELGFGTILIDAGWDCAENGGYGDFETGILGDYKAVRDRFPDMPGLVRKIHDMGLRVELWSGPFWEGKKSKAYREKMKDCHIVIDGNERHEICPKHPLTREHLRESFARVARTYNIDGIWVDAADSVPTSCEADHDHLPLRMGEAFVECMMAAREGLKSVNPDAVMEMRVLHGNLNTKCTIDLVQPSDAPKNYEFLRLAGIHIRPWAYDILLKNDPMIWPPGADAVTVGKFLATMVTNGVPALSVDFLTAPYEHLKMTKAWLKFYREHRDTLIHGDFQLFGADFGQPDMALVGDEEAVIYLRNSETSGITLPGSIKQVCVLNCTSSKKLMFTISPMTGLCSIQLCEPDLSECGAPELVEADGNITLKECPEAGAAVINIVWQ